MPSFIRLFSPLDNCYSSVAACAAVVADNKTVTKLNSPASLPDLGPAPELTNDIWLNVAQAAPLRLEDLRGKVVAIDMWTFG